MAQSCDAYGNVMGRAHVSPIIDIRMYYVALAGGKVIALTINVIAKSMCTQCDETMNE